MGVNSRLLTLHGGGGAFVDTFDTLNPRWQVLNGGTIAAVAGALRATAAGDWLGTLVTNGETWTGGPPPTGWTTGNCTPTQQDATALGIAPSGGADEKIMQLVQGGVPAGLCGTGVISAIKGTQYRGSGYLRAPSTNLGLKGAYLYGVFTPGYVVEFIREQVTAEDVWQYKSGISVACPVTETGVRVYLLQRNGEAGDTAWFDKIELYRQNTPCRLLGWNSPNGIFTLDMAMPATAVTPFSWLTRYTDALNYWEVRVTPNTAGNDLEIIQVTAGVETQRAAVDVDWTASATEQLEISVRNTTIATRYKKTGGPWTAGASYATATQGQTSGIHGVMLWDTAVNRLANLMVQP